MSSSGSSQAPDTSPANGAFGSFGGIGYGIGVSVGMLLLITTITLASYFCTRANTQQQQLPARRRHRRNGADNNESTNAAAVAAEDMEMGLDEETLMTYPTLMYSQAKKEEKGTAATCCSICLADYKDTDMLRQLPECNHLFHLKCVDPWLRLNPTCPLCRTSPLPSPMPTPLAEVVPLARQV